MVWAVPGCRRHATGVSWQPVRGARGLLELRYSGISYMFTTIGIARGGGPLHGAADPAPLTPYTHQVTTAFCASVRSSMSEPPIEVVGTAGVLVE